MVQIIFWGLLAYIAYRFLFGFVLPVSKATRDVRRQFRAAQEEMASRMRQQQGYGTGDTVVNEGQEPRQPSATQKEIRKEYIDFEEIKE
ncbi:MAG: hypothetical protein QM664_07480 [Flavihumibacter sp.]